MLTIVSLIVLPLLSFIGGILGLKSDPSDPQDASKTKWIVAILVFSAIASIGMSISGHQADVAQKKKDDGNIEFLKSRLTLVQGNTEDIKGTTIDIKGLLANFLSGVGVAQARIKNIQENGLSTPENLKLVQAGITGDDLIKRLLAQIQAENQKQQTTVVYYNKDVDPNDVNGLPLENSLQQAGFKLEKTRQGRKNPDLPTNAIWTADNVPPEQAKFVAYTLMRAGVEIRAIRTFSGTGRKPNEIEIGADRAIAERLPLTFQQIQAKQSFSRNLD
jgi:hypothetical protein